ncbi:MAG: hypothetical protein ACJA13_001041 [Paraglaciecola sp.]|jgi:hypothetical protein
MTLLSLRVARNHNDVRSWQNSSLLLNSLTDRYLSEADRQEINAQCLEFAQPAY